MPPDTILEVWLDSGEPIEQVPDSLRIEGYIVSEILPELEFFKLKVLRPE